MRPTLIVFALVFAVALLVPLAARAGRAALIEPPPEARPIGRSTVDEIRAFPEIASKTTRAGGAAREKLVGVEGVDRLFETDRSFGDTVAYFDAALRGHGFRTRARVETASATAWTAVRPDGTVAQVAVRNTTPTSIEVTEVVSTTPGLPNE